MKNKIFAITMVILMASCTKTNTIKQVKTITKTDTIVKNTIVIDSVFSPYYKIIIRNKALDKSGWLDTLYIPQLTAAVIYSGTITVSIQAQNPLPPFNYQANGSSGMPHDTLNWYSMPFNAFFGNTIINYSLAPGKVLLTENNGLPYPDFVYNFKVTIKL